MARKLRKRHQYQPPPLHFGPPRPRWLPRRNLLWLVLPYWLCLGVLSAFVWGIFMLTRAKHGPLSSDSHIGNHWLLPISMSIVLLVVTLRHVIGRIHVDDDQSRTGIVLLLFAGLCIQGVFLQSFLHRQYGTVYKSDYLPYDPEANYYINPGIKAHWQRKGWYMDVHRAGRSGTQYSYYCVFPLTGLNEELSATPKYWLLYQWHYNPGEKMAGFNAYETVSSFQQKADLFISRAGLDGIRFYELVDETFEHKQARQALYNVQSGYSDSPVFLRPSYDAFRHRAWEERLLLLRCTAIVMVGSLLLLFCQRWQQEA